MADGHPQGRRPPGPGALTARLAVAAAALAVTAAGLRAATGPASWDDGPWHQDGIALGVAVEVVFAGLLVAVEVRRRRDRDAGLPAAGLRAGLRAFLLAVLIAMPVLVLINAAGQIPARPRTQRQPPGAGGRPPSPSARPHVGTVTGGRIDYTLVGYAALIAAILVAAAIGVILVRRRSRPADWADLGEMPEEEPEAALRRAVQSGQAALGEVDDARLAIIACYAAMEGSLGRAGAVRGAAETPDELLGRAAAAGLAGGGAAAALTALFYEARFSSHPLPAAARAQARDALAGLAAALADREARAAAASITAADPTAGSPTAKDPTTGAATTGGPVSPGAPGHPGTPGGPGGGGTR